MTAPQPPGPPDRRLAGLDDSLRMLRDRLDALRYGVARFEPEPPAAPQHAPPPPPRPAAAAPVPPPATAPPPEGDELVARLRGLLDELRTLTGEADAPAAPMPRDWPPQPS